MTSYPLSEQATPLRPPLPTPLPTPSLSSEDGKHIDSDHKPILERENDDDGPPPIRSPQSRNRLSSPPAPPTSRGTSFDEPLWTQNARSSADLWLRGWWIEQRLVPKYAQIDAHTIYNAPYWDPVLMSEPPWDDGYDSRATLIQSYQSSDHSGQDDDSANGMLSSRRRRNSLTNSSLTCQSTEDYQLTAQHRNFGTEDLRRLDEPRAPGMEGFPFRESGVPIHTRSSAFTSPTVTLNSKAGHACYVGYMTTAERTINFCHHGLNELSPFKDHPIKDQAQPAACERDFGGRGPGPGNIAEVEPMTLNCSVWEDDEREGRWTRLAALFHSPNGLRRAPRKGRLRTRMSKLFKCLSCCSSVEES